MAARHGCVCEDKQRSRDVAAVALFDGRRLVLPDTQICKNKSVVLPEIKHKSPTLHGQYGWEEYRLVDCVEYAKQSGLQVIMAIHDWALAGGKDCDFNDIRHWRWADVLVMAEKWDYRNPKGKTWLGGQSAVVPMLYWNTSRFAPLESHPFFAEGERCISRKVRRNPSRPTYRQTMLFNRNHA